MAHAPSDPYHILVSEMMLQQTQVDRVLPKYHEWLAKYPSLEALATADETARHRDVAPARLQHPPARLQSIAREAVARYGGRCRRTRRRCCRSRASAPYTAGAILSFAFGQRAAILDTNVARVLFRVFVGKGDPKAHAMRRHLWAVSRTVLPMRHVFDFNQALMDFGATLCTARKPRPVARCADVRSRARCRRLPRRRCPLHGSSSPPRSIERDGAFLVTRRLEGTHLEGYWEFPGGKCEAGESRQDVPVA